MEILYASLAGLAFGSIISIINFLLLKKFVDNIGKGNSNPKDSTKKIFKLYAVRYVLDVLTLLVIFLGKDYLPFRWEYMALFAAVGLTAPMQILFATSGMNKKVTSALSGKSGEEK